MNSLNNFSVRGGGGEGEEYSQKSWVGVCGPLPKALTHL